MSNQTKNSNLNYLIDPMFNRVNRLVVLCSKKGYDRTLFSKFYTPTIEVKDYNVLIDGKSFFDVPVKNKEGAYMKTIEMGKTKRLRSR